jgi:hypothetical protein
MNLRRIRLLSFAAVPVCATVVSLGALASPASAATALPRSGYCGQLEASMDYNLNHAWVYNDIGDQFWAQGDYDTAIYDYGVADQAMDAYYADWARSIAFGC